ncbi:MAG TPA: transposase zinc-binding domain-containing protein, partial [Candidatus Binataceae bacterium]
MAAFSASTLTRCWAVVDQIKDSCCKRHCPKCRSLARAQWLEHRRAELLLV